MTKSKPLVAWDTCVILSAIDKHPNRYPAIELLEKRAREKELGIVISVVCIAEVLYVGEESCAGESQMRMIDQWFDNPHLSVYNIDRGIARQAASLRREFRISTPDALILATALRCNVKALFTFDGADEGGKKTGSKTHLLELDGRVSNIRIVIPDHAATGTLALNGENGP